MTWFKAGLYFGAGIMAATIGIVLMVIVLGALSLEARERRQLQRIIGTVKGWEGTD